MENGKGEGERGREKGGGRKGEGERVEEVGGEDQQGCSLERGKGEGERGEDQLGWEWIGWKGERGKGWRKWEGRISRDGNGSVGKEERERKKSREGENT